MKTILHKSESRGDADHGWLHSRHTFSFANYNNPERVRFGLLRVLNDDYVAPGMGFSTHTHDNMEIISIPLEGDLEHKDSMGNISVIKHGDIQVLSAGTGISHSEYNKNKDFPVKFLQICVFPNKRDVTPHYDQITLDLKKQLNKFAQILSPNADDEGVWIHQDAWFHMGDLDKGTEVTYSMKDADKNGLYVFILEGKAEAAGILLERRDGLGITEANEVKFKAEEDAKILLMEIPMGK